MHRLDTETEKFLIWLWANSGAFYPSGRWDSHEKAVTVFRAPRLDAVFRNVKRKHLQQLAGSKGYGGALAKLKHLGDKRWQKVEVVLTTEGQRWADSPYLRARYQDHPSHPEVKAAKAEAEAKAEQQELIKQMQRRIEKLEQEAGKNGY